MSEILFNPFGKFWGPADFRQRSVSMLAGQMQVPVLDKQRTGETLLWLKHHESPQKAGQRGTVTPTNQNRSQWPNVGSSKFTQLPHRPSPQKEIHIPCRVGRIDTHQGIHCSNKSHRQDHLKADEQCQFHAIDFVSRKMAENFMIFMD